MAGDDRNDGSRNHGEGVQVDADQSGAGGALGSAVFLVALLAFLGSALANVFALVTGGDVLASLAVNAAAALALLARTASDTYTDPDSNVTSLPGALGTALLLFGIYALVASVVVATTSPWHDRFQVAIWLGAAAAVAAVLGFFTFPVEVVGSDEGGADGVFPGDDDFPGDGEVATDDRGEPDTSGES